VLRFIRSLLTSSSRQPDPVPAKRLGLALSGIDGAVVVEKHFPRPKWKIIHAWIKEHVPEEDRPLAWQEIAFDWVSTLKNHLGADYAVYRSPNFILLTSRGLNASKSILRTCELAVQYIVDWLGPVAAKRGHGQHVVLDFATIENYYDYLRGGYLHIAVPPSHGMQNVLIHELAHNRLAHLPLPKWLNEGIAVTMERKIGGKQYGRIDRELHQKHRAYWTTQTILAFWTGESFHDLDGEVVHLSYSLADILVDLLVQEFPNFMDFVCEADQKDAGLTAAHQCFGIGLNDLVSTFLGSGDWTPEIAPSPDA